MAYNFPYLKDSAFLKAFDNIKLKEQYVKLIILTFDEAPIQEIQGKVLSGNFTLDGSSGMRRTGNINLIADDSENNLSNAKYLLSINKKIEILIGFKNTTEKYENYPIIWFPQGVYVIISSNIIHNINDTSISLTLHDKMALLNGECGGTLPASVVFNQIEDVNEDGSIQTTFPTIYQIIQELVNHFGGQQLGKIIISDIDNKIKKVMRWGGSTPLYLYQQPQSNGITYNSFSTNYNELVKRQQEGGGTIKEFSYGEDIGYVLTDFIYPKELIGNAGDTVVTILDQIKELLGNYEYFYDINGNFRFQQIKNYLNTSYSTFLINEINMNNYLVDYSNGKSVYNFEDANIIQSYSNSPQYQQIKNDFLVWGKRTSISGQEIPIRYHLTIDSKPTVGNTYKVFFFTDPDDEILKTKRPIEFKFKADFPEKGKNGQYYYATDTNIIYKWEENTKKYEQTQYSIETITTTDYRTELYMTGVVNEPFGLNSNYYYTQLKNEWPKIYDIKEKKFFENVLKQPSNIDYFLDFIDTQTAISEFNVNNIGRRTVTIVDDSINCIFEPKSPDIVIIEIGSENAKELQEECENRKQEYVQVRSEIYSMLSTGGVLKSAYEEIKKELYQYTKYNQQISLTTLPIYYLQPNTRITVRDNISGIHGDYIIKSISLPLDINGTMTLSCTKAFEGI